jgi:citrate lyase subunit beta / citryl-CoA lyase
MAESGRRVRSALFTPGTDAARLRKAITLGADVCIFDLEDSVPLARLGEARETVRAALEELGGRTSIWVRIHSAGSPEMTADLAGVALDKPDAVVLPKVVDWSSIEVCRRAIQQAGGREDMPIVPIIESAAGALNSVDIAQARNVRCLAFGRFDLSAELGIDPDRDGPALVAARAAVVLGSAAAGIHPPLDAPWVKIHDLEGLGSAARRARADGFGGMLLIHPSHVSIVNQAFSPSQDEIAWAQGIMASAVEATSEGRGAYARDGQMVDEAIVKRARAILRDVPR